MLHVARRASFGPTPVLLGQIRAVGVDAWIDEQLNPERIDDSAVEASVARLSRAQADPTELRGPGTDGDRWLDDLRTAAVVRATQSQRQLLEVLVDFWHDRLAASSVKFPVAIDLPAYDRDVIRVHALGRFRDLLRAATTSGAMLEYLDTTASSTPRVNENHARELLELHTVGRGSGYTEADVAGAARVLSGWRIDGLGRTVKFDPERHDDRPSKVLSWSTPGRSGPAAAADLSSLLEYLATHPATARRVAAALATRFVGDGASDALVEQLATTYLRQDTHIGDTLAALFASDEFRSGGVPQFRRPFDLLAAMIRATNATLDVDSTVQRAVPLPDLEGVPAPLGSITDGVLGIGDDLLGSTDSVDPVAAPATELVLPRRALAATVVRVLRTGGQDLFAAPNPAGHRLTGGWDTGDALLRRWTLADALARDALGGIRIDPAVLAQGAATAGAAADAIGGRVLGAPPSPATRDAALYAVGLTAGDPITDDARRGLLAIALASPEAQVR